LKPQQDKFVKDKLLNEIFQEIADENAATGDTGYQEEKSIDHGKKLARKRLIQKIRQRVIIALLVVLIIFVLFSPKYDTSDLDIIDNKKDMYIVPKANQISVEEEQREVKAEQEAREQKKEREKSAKKAPTIKISEKETIIDTKIIPEPDTKNTQTLNIQEPKTAREKAKNQLMHQMQN
jgi:hypothetical protein